MVTQIGQNTKSIILIVVLVVIFGAIFYLQFSQNKLQPIASIDVVGMDQLENKQDKAKKYEVAKEITTPDGFINSEPFTISDLIAEKKVVLLDIWTYSCINCQRTLPYLNAWHEKYKDQGLVIIGLHTPEFEFEKDYQNVSEAVEKFGIKYPVVLDNDYSTWRAYNNRYWPRKYLIDVDGFIVYDHIGEGGYEETELAIQKALAERSRVLATDMPVSSGVVNPDKDLEVDFRQVQTPETYFGALRNKTLANGLENKIGTQNLKEPKNIASDKLYLSGRWDIQNEYAKNTEAGAKIIIKYTAKSVYLVASSENGVGIKVLRDGKELSDSAGKDILDKNNSSTIVENEQLYRLVEDDDYGEHTLEIIIEDPGLEVFAFTFG